MEIRERKIASRQRQVDRARLVATLSILMAEEQAARISADACRKGDRQGILRTAMRLARQQQTIARIRSHLRRGDDISRSALLSHRAGGDTTGRVALAFQLGFDLSYQELASLLNLSPNDLGNRMSSTISGSSPIATQACTGWKSLLGRYRGDSLPLQQRVNLFRHVTDCAGCSGALQNFRQRDAAVLAAIDNEYARMAANDAVMSRESRPTLRCFTPVIAMVFALVVVGAAAVAAHRFTTTTEPRPIALASGTAEPSTNGWLLRVSQQGDIEALDLDSGFRQPVFKGSSHSLRVGDHLSPSGRQLADWTVHEGSTNRGVLSIIDLNGQTRHTWEWQYQGFDQFPVAWIDETTVVFSESPMYRSDDNDPWSHAARADRDSRLFAVDVTSGRRWTLHEGLVERAVPSPDGNAMVIVLPLERDMVGATIQIRPIRQDGLGEPVASIQHRYVDGSHGPIWAGDSSRVYFSAIGDLPTGPQPLTADDSLIHTANNPINLAVLSLNSTLVVLTDVYAGQIMSPIAASPDGTRMIFLERNQSARPDDWAIWQAAFDGSDREALIQPSGPFPWLDNSVVWSSDRQSMLVARVDPFYLPLAPEDGTSVSVPSTSFVRYDSNGASQLIRCSSVVWAGRTIRWLQPDAIQAGYQPAQRLHMPAFTRPVPVESVSPEHRIDASSARSPDGSLLLLDRATGTGSVPSIWQPDDLSGLVAQVRGTGDFQWLSDGSGVAGVASANLNPAGPSRIVFLHGGPTNTQPDLHELLFDPLRIGTDTTRRYAHPVLSPDGSATAFFLIDTQNSMVELWLAEWRQEPKRLHFWHVPEHAEIQSPLAAFWSSNRAIVFAQASDWTDGSPDRVDLKQVQLVDDSDIQVDDLASFRTHGNETGVILTELRWNVTGQTIAVRLRHTGPGGAEDMFDSVHLIPAQDVTLAFEVFRGAPGEGMNWSRDGEWLVAGLGDRLGLLSNDGRQVQHLAAGLDGEKRYPIWVNASEIWFDQEYQGSHVIRGISRQ